VLSVPSVHPGTTIARPYLSGLGSALLDYAKAWFGVTRKLSSREVASDDEVAKGLIWRSPKEADR
jgi:hypothetical protein